MVDECKPLMCGDRQLLPTAVTPEHYQLHLTPDLTAFTYSGEVVVTLRVREPCAAVTFHAKDLNITAGVAGAYTRPLFSSTLALCMG